MAKATGAEKEKTDKKKADQKKTDQKKDAQKTVEKKKDEEKKSPKKKVTKKKKGEKKGSKTIIGVLVCCAIVELTILFLTLELQLTRVNPYGITTLWQAIFIIPLHLPTFMAKEMWSIMAAITIGTFIAGLYMKNIKKGMLVGAITFGIMLLLQLALGFLFDFTALQAWYSLISTLGSNIVIDYLVTVVILMVMGATGGAITRE